uniref:seipin-like n=1 Tax=Styela clava TaxID=7725 RepID=UPI00193A7761|nr:seipin-like [Styela clava]
MNAFVLSQLQSCYEIYNVRFRPWMEERWRFVKPYFNVSKTVIFHGIVVFVIAAFCLYISAFLFGALYFYNMPTIYHSFDLNFQYSRQCIQQHRNYLRTGIGDTDKMYKNACYPKAMLDFDSIVSKKVPQPDQKFMVYLILDLPESQTNLDIGMFMVTMRYGSLFSSHPVSIKYRPFLIRLASIAFYWPLLLFDLIESKQTITVPLFDEARFSHVSKMDVQNCLRENGSTFKDQCHHRIVEIQIDYPDIQIYSAQLQVTAIFSGLQYFLYQWPVFSFLVGIAVFFVPVLASMLVIFYIILWNPYQRIQEYIDINGIPARRLLGRRRRNREAVNDEGPQELPLVEVVENEQNRPNNDEREPGNRTTSSFTTSSIEVVGPLFSEDFKKSGDSKDDDQPSTSQSENFDETNSESELRKRKLNF